MTQAVVAIYIMRAGSFDLPANKTTGDLQHSVDLTLMQWKSSEIFTWHWQKNNRTDEWCFSLQHHDSQIKGTSPNCKQILSTSTVKFLSHIRRDLRVWANKLFGQALGLPVHLRLQRGPLLMRLPSWRAARLPGCVGGSFDLLVGSFAACHRPQPQRDRTRAGRRAGRTTKAPPGRASSKGAATDELMALITLWPVALLTYARRPRHNRPIFWFPSKRRPSSGVAHLCGERMCRLAVIILASRPLIWARSGEWARQTALSFERGSKGPPRPGPALLIPLHSTQVTSTGPLQWQFWSNFVPNQFSLISTLIFQLWKFHLQIQMKWHKHWRDRRSK